MKPQRKQKIILKINKIASQVNQSLRIDTQEPCNFTLTPNYREIIHCLKLIKRTFPSKSVKKNITRLYQIFILSPKYKKDLIQEANSISMKSQTHKNPLDQVRVCLQYFCKVEQPHSSISHLQIQNVHISYKRYKAIVMEQIKKSYQLIQNKMVNDYNYDIVFVKPVHIDTLLKLLLQYRVNLSAENMITFVKILKLTSGLNLNMPYPSKQAIIKLYNELCILLEVKLKLNTKIHSQIDTKKNEKKKFQLTLYIVNQNLENVGQQLTTTKQQGSKVNHAIQQINKCPSQQPLKQAKLFSIKKTTLLKDGHQSIYNEREMIINRYCNLDDDNIDHLQREYNNSNKTCSLTEGKTKQIISHIIGATYRYIQTIITDQLKLSTKIDNIQMKNLHYRLLKGKHYLSNKSRIIFIRFMRAINGIGPDEQIISWQEIEYFHKQCLQLIDIKFRPIKIAIGYENTEQKRMAHQSTSQIEQAYQALTKFKEEPLILLVKPICKSFLRQQDKIDYQIKKIIAIAFIENGYSLFHLNSYDFPQDRIKFSQIQQNIVKYRILLSSIVIESFKRLQIFFIEECNYILLQYRTEQIRQLQDILINIHSLDINCQVYLEFIKITFNLKHAQNFQISKIEALVFYQSVSGLLKAKVMRRLSLIHKQLQTINMELKKHRVYKPIQTSFDHYISQSNNSTTKRDK